MDGPKIDMNKRTSFLEKKYRLKEKKLEKRKRQRYAEKY